jgi:membrane protein required for colicin V production
MGDLFNLEMLNVLDLLLIGALFLSAIVGVLRGLTREILSALSWALSGWFAQQYRDDVGVYLPDWLKFNLLPDAAKFVIVFIATLVALSLVSWGINKLLTISIPTVMNRMFGAGFGILRGMVICILVLFGAQNIPIATALYQESMSASHLSWALDWVAELDFGNRLTGD